MVFSEFTGGDPDYRLLGRKKQCGQQNLPQYHRQVQFLLDRQGKNEGNRELCTGKY